MKRCVSASTLLCSLALMGCGGKPVRVASEKSALAVLSPSPAVADSFSLFGGASAVFGNYSRILLVSINFPALAKEGSGFTSLPAEVEADVTLTNTAPAGSSFDEPIFASHAASIDASGGPGNLTLQDGDNILTLSNDVVDASKSTGFAKAAAEFEAYPGSFPSSAGPLVRTENTAHATGVPLTYNEVDAPSTEVNNVYFVGQMKSFTQGAFNFSCQLASNAQNGPCTVFANDRIIGAKDGAPVFEATFDGQGATDLFNALPALPNGLHGSVGTNASVLCGDDPTQAGAKLCLGSDW